MDISIPADLQAFVENSIRSGSYADAGAVVADALRLLERREHVRRQVKAGLDQLDQGQSTEYDENSLERFLADIEAEQLKRHAGAGSDA